MKKIYFILFVWLSVVFTSCEEDYAGKEQYKKVIYIVGSENKVYNFEHPLGNEPTRGFVSVYCGGSKGPDGDVTVELIEDQEILDKYNYTEFGDKIEKYLKRLPVANYSMPSLTGILKDGGEPFVKLSIYVKTLGLSPDSVYVIPLKIKEVSDYEVNPKLSSILYTVKLLNQYSGEYKMKAKLVESDDEQKTKDVFKTKIATPIDENTVRFFIAMEKEDPERIHLATMTCRIGADNMVAVQSPYVTDLGGSTYDPKKKIFQLNYRYFDADADKYYDVHETLEFVGKI